MKCVFLRSQIAAALTVAGLVSTSVPAQTTPSLPPASSFQMSQSNSGPPPRFPIIRDGKWGLIDGSGTVVVTPQFDDIAGCASSGRSMAARNTPQPVRDGLNLRDCAPLRQELIPISVGGKWGAIDANGMDVIPPSLDGIRIWTRFVAAREGDKWGILDRTGRYTIPQRFEAVTSVGELTAVRVDGKWGLIDAEGDFIMTPQLDEAPLLFSGDEMVLAEREGRWGLLDKGGAWVHPPVYDDVAEFHEGLAAVTKEGRTSYINQDGEVVLQLDCEGVSFSEGLAGIIIDAKWGYVDRNGARVIEPRFDRGYEFEYGLAKALVGDSIVYIGREGNEVYVMEFPGLRRNVRIQ